MIRTSMYGKHVAITVIVMILFIIIGQVAFHLALEMRRSGHDNAPPVFLAKLIDEISPADRTRALALMDKANVGLLPVNLWLLDENGRVLYPLSGKKFPYEWGKLPHPATPYQTQDLARHGLPGLPKTVVRLPGEPAQYFFMDIDVAKDKGGPPFWPIFGALILSVVFATVVSVFILFYSLRKKAALADAVISELQRGNLKARFPIKKLDEVGQAMLRFNSMAEEIERLVERLRETEQSRMSLLQELAHDLRTPVASLKNLLETMNDRKASLSEELRNEFLALSVKEVEYFQRLVEDLLFLARVSEPRYRAACDRIDLASMLADEVESAAALHARGPRKIEIDLRFEIRSSFIAGDSHLLRRLFRNAMDNAFSFAAGKVSVIVRELDAEHIECVIQDDGPGLSEEAVRAFGARKISRILGQTGPGRLSVGLGSVIMKAVLGVHGGEVTIENAVDSSGQNLGAKLSIKLPVA